MVSLGDYLRANYEVNLVITDAINQRLRRAWAGHRVAGRDLASDVGKQPGDFFRQPLDARPASGELALDLTLRARLGLGAYESAVVAIQCARKAVLHEPGGAIGTLHTVAAGAAECQRCIAPAIEEQGSLLTGFKCRGQGGSQWRRQPGAARGLALPHINCFNIGQGGAAVTGRQLEPCVATALYIAHRFKRRRGGGKDDRNLLQSPAHHCHVTGVIDNALFLLVGGVMFFIDDNDAKLGKRQPER